MMQGIFAIRDSKLEAYSTPWFSPNKATALRTFSDAVNDPNTNLNKHPDDFGLFHLGQFDVDTGEIVPNAPNHLGLAREYHNEIQQSPETPK